MRNVTEVLRLSLGEGLSVRQVSQSLGMSRPTVQRYVARALAAGVSWPLAADVDDTRLAGLLFRRPECSPEMVRPLPDWGLLHHELRKGVTLQLLWMEYKQRLKGGQKSVQLVAASTDCYPAGCFYSSLS
jgi:transposase